MAELSIAALIILLVILIALDYRRTRELREFTLKFSGKEQSPKSADPCEPSHDLVPIDAQPLKGGMLACEQTVCLKRCSRCGIHVQCAHCDGHVVLDGDDRLQEHEDPAPPARTCEGSGRFYFHMFGTRMEAER